MPTSNALFNPTRRNFFNYLRRLPTGSRVLDVGMGFGKDVLHLRKNFPHLKVYGTNYWLGLTMKTRARVIRLKAKKRGALAKGDNLPFRSNSFDVVLATSTFGMALEKREFVREVHRVLKKGGKGILQATLSVYPDRKSRDGIDESFFTLKRKRGQIVPSSIRCFTKHSFNEHDEVRVVNEAPMMRTRNQNGNIYRRSVLIEKKRAKLRFNDE